MENKAPRYPADTSDNLNRRDEIQGSTDKMVKNEPQDIDEARRMANMKRRREYHKSAGAAALERFGDLPKREKIYHPTRDFTKKRTHGPEERGTSNNQLRGVERFRANTDEYFKIGALNFLSKGNLAVLPEKFIIDGHRLKENNIYRDNIDFKLHTKELVSDIVEETDEEKFNKLEADTIKSAIKRGAYVKTNAYADDGIEFSLPIKQSGLVDFMKKYDINPSDPEIRKLSYSGFNNILKDMASVSDADSEEISQDEKDRIVADGMNQLNWYFDNFGYNSGEDNKNFKKFLDRFHGQFKHEDETWQNLYRRFLKQRPEYRDLFPQTPEEEQKAKNKEMERIATGEEYSYDEFIRQVNIIIQRVCEELEINPTEQGVLREVDHIERINRGGNAKEGKYTKGEKYSYMLQKVRRFMDEVETIKSLDPGAQFYIEKFDSGKVDENGIPIKKMPRFPYLVVRFGNNKLGYNNVYAETTDFTGAFYAWRGKGDEWREVFSGSKGTARAMEEVIAIPHGRKGHGVLEPESLQYVYDNAHNFAPLPTAMLSVSYEHTNKYRNSIISTGQLEIRQNA